MLPYQKYTTTVVGAYSVPRWYGSLERLVVAGELSVADMADVQFRATQGAILDQQAAGTDIITGGEMHRRTNNRHAPPNAMLNYFWAKIPAFAGATRPKPITEHDPGVFHPAAVCRGKISDDIDLGLVEEFAMVSAYASRPVKITMTGPHMLAKVAYNEYYENLPAMMMDLGKLLSINFKKLAAAGCRHIQVDEPLFAVSNDAEVLAAVDAINTAFDGLPGDVHASTHVCQGNYAMGFDYDGQLGHRYFEGGRYPADLICKIECASLLIEGDMTPRYEGILGNKQLGVGVCDVQDVNVESGEVLADRIRAFAWLAPEQTLVTTSCGLNHLPRHIAFGKLKAMTAAKTILGGTRA
jgi:5-methyltetrahydropteroyltriglutamate--homocysteine methyltransferase